KGLEPEGLAGVVCEPEVSRKGWSAKVCNLRIRYVLAATASQELRTSQFVGDRRKAERGQAAGKAEAAARPVRQAVALDHPAGDDRRAHDLRAGDREFSDEPVE